MHSEQGLLNFNSIQDSNLHSEVAVNTIDSKSSVKNVVISIFDVAIYIIVAISIVSAFISFTVSLIMTITKTKGAKYAWILLGISVLIILLSIVVFTLLSVYQNFSSLNS